MFKRVVHSLRILAILSLLLGLVVACDDEPIEPEPTQVEASAAEPAPKAATYQHPSGAFSLEAPGWDYQDGDDYAIFDDGDSLIVATFGPAQTDLTEETVAVVAEEVLDTLVASELISDYEVAQDDYDSLDNGYVTYFWFEWEYGESESDIFLTQKDEIVYALALLTSDYDSVENDWFATVESFAADSSEAVAEGSSGGEATQAPAEGGQEVAAGAADSGFRPDVNGFRFENYGDELDVTNLTAAEMQRMFGDQVCASMAGGECILTPPAKQWMKQTNKYMDGGHCEGMAVLSSLIYFDQIDPGDFGGSVAHDLDIRDEALQREIAYWWTTQSTWPGGYENRVNESPSAVLDTLIESFEEGWNASEWWALGIYKPDLSDGHAITPFAVEDLGDGRYNILVYDNNYPDVVREIEVDRNADTWQYWASPNPDIEDALYEGDEETQTLEIVAISPRLGQQDWEFAAAEGSSKGGAPGLAAPAQQHYEIWLEGSADLLIEDEDGKRIGFVDGEFVNEIPGAQGESFRLLDVWADDSEPIYNLPADKLYEVIVDGSYLEEAESSAVTMFGPGFFLYLDDILLDPGEQDSIIFLTEDGMFGLNYQTAYAESPEIVVGMETEEADYAFSVQATELVGEEDSFYVFVDLTENVFAIDTSDNTEAVTMDIYMLRIDDEGEHVFGSDDLVLDPGSTVYMSFEQWDEETGSMVAAIDLDGDGEPDEFVDLEDIADEFEWDEDEID